MCGRKQVYRINLNSANKSSGTNQDANYFVRLPYTIRRGSIFVESLGITNAGTLFNGITNVKVASPDFPNSYSWFSDNIDHHVIDDIGLQENYFVSATAGNEMKYKRHVNYNDVGLPISNYNFYNKQINIKLIDQDDTALPNAQLTSYSLTLVIIDEDPDLDRI